MNTSLVIPRGSSERGACGERLAERFLQEERGMCVVERNWRNPNDRREELDLVCLDRGVLVFVEVKTRAAGGRVRGYGSVDGRKRLAVKRAAFSYIGMIPRDTRPRAVRFDVVEVYLPRMDGVSASPGLQVVHLANIPLFPQRFRPV